MDEPSAERLGFRSGDEPHTYQIGTSGPRENTAIALPKKILSVFFDTADRAGGHRTATAHTTARPG